jgi:dCMP deaminase
MCKQLNDKTHLPRQSWNHYFMSLANLVSTRSTCLRKQVGCVVVKDKTIISTGYNGSLPGEVHCDTHNCFLQNNHCIRTIHAETNAINQAAKTGVCLSKAYIYCTTQPCWNCFKNIIQSGITHIYYEEPYSSLNELYVHYLSQNPQIVYEQINVD